jgi:hypothetical protein
MGLPHDAPSGGGYEDDATAPDVDRLTDELSTPGYDGYSHDSAAGDGYADPGEYDFDEDDDLELDDSGDGGFGEAGWDPGAGRAGGTGRM